jgi:putative thioredoxin
MTPKAATSWIRDVTEQNFDLDVVQESMERPVIVDFWAPWCAPCRTLGPILEKLTNERQGAVTLAKINSEDAPQLAEYFQISAIPAVKIFAEGQLIHEFQGLLPEASLRELFDQLAPSPEMLKEAEAVRGAETSDPASAERHYREAIAKDAEKPDPRLGLARVLFEQKRFDEIPEILEPVGSAGEPGAASDAILARIKLARMVEALPDEPTLRSRVAAEPKNAQARLELGTVLSASQKYAEGLAMLLSAAELDYKLAPKQVREVMVQVFYAVGASDPLANEYRTKLARLLY